MGMKVKHGGAWKDGTPKVKHGGVWKDPVEAFAKKNGVWESVWTAAPDVLLPVGAHKGATYIGALNSDLKAVTNNGLIMYDGGTYDLNGDKVPSSLEGLMGFSENPEGNIKIGVTDPANTTDNYLCLTGTGDQGLTKTVGGDNCEKGTFGSQRVLNTDDAGGDTSGLHNYVWWWDTSLHEIQVPKWYLYDDGKNPPYRTAGVTRIADIYHVSSSGRFTVAFYCYGTSTVTQRFYVFQYGDLGYTTTTMADLIGGSAHKYSYAPRVYISDDGLTVLVAEWMTYVYDWKIRRYTRATETGPFTYQGYVTFDGVELLQCISRTYAQWVCNADLSVIVMAYGKTWSSQELRVYTRSADGAYVKSHNLTLPPKTIWDSRANYAAVTRFGVCGHIRMSGDGSHVAVPYMTRYGYDPDGKGTQYIYFRGFLVYGP